MIIAKYSLFAVIAMAFNLLLQNISFLIYDKEYSLLIAMILGTAAGLVVKFILDKYFIFMSIGNGMKNDLQQFSMYSLTGILTTLLFWFVEFSFDYFIDSYSAKYYGAVFGLTIGYIIKYQLDKSFVFRSQQ